jgi:NCS1 family nucleobase:cation symporter-1
MVHTEFVSFPSAHPALVRRFATNIMMYSAASFSSFLGGYSLFLGAIAGVIIVDFWICRRRSLRIGSLYEMHGTHYFTAGFNLRAFLAFICGIVPNMPGLAAVCGQAGIPKGATYLYSLSWLVSILVSGSVYWVLFQIKPFKVDEEEEKFAIDGVEAETVMNKESSHVILKDESNM